MFSVTCSSIRVLRMSSYSATLSNISSSYFALSSVIFIELLGFIVEGGVVGSGGADVSGISGSELHKGGLLDILEFTHHQDEVDELDEGLPPHELEVEELLKPHQPLVD